MSGWLFGMGVAAVFNPCGVALLPAVLAWLGGTAPVASGIWWRMGQATLAGIAMAAGFTAVVAGLAVVLHGIGLALGPLLHAAMLLLGGALVLAGGLLALGLWHLPVDQWLGVRPFSPAPMSAPWATWLVMGVVYGIGSLSCTLPLFVAALASVLAGSWPDTVRAAGTIGLGVTLVLVAFSWATLWVREGLTRWLHRLGRWVPLGLGTIVSLAGAYLVYYWAWGPGRWLG
ncbi:MAG: hypothetical protein K6U14_11920 [Firmicutes bacterium]|nr:hypothetical protein [Alicyclobacillaceae bacterium]MCL6498320.1 hypothetical protein [Bacillota bacterium]